MKVIIKATVRTRLKIIAGVAAGIIILLGLLQLGLIPGLRPEVLPKLRIGP